MVGSYVSAEAIWGDGPLAETLDQPTYTPRSHRRENTPLCRVVKLGYRMTRDPRISGIFYYFEQYTTISSGRTVGRKVGVVQEILCKKLFLDSPEIQDCIIYEPKLQGRSGATHKVEFVLFQPVAAVQLSIGKSYSVDSDMAISLVSVDASIPSAKVKLTIGSKTSRRTVQAGKILPIDDSDLVVRIVSVSEKSVRISVLDTSVPIASIESKRVGAQRFSGSKKLGSGIQTIEKAKQASLVAVDLDLNYNESLLVQSGVKSDRVFRSFVVLGNGVHWTKHDLSILETYVDYTYLATDEAIIRYAEFARGIADEKKEDFFDFFMAYFKGMTVMPPDAFTVSNDDFVAMRPTDAMPLREAVEKQIKPYKEVIV